MFYGNGPSLLSLIYLTKLSRFAFSKGKTKCAASIKSDIDPGLVQKAVRKIGIKGERLRSKAVKNFRRVCFYIRCEHPGGRPRRLSTELTALDDRHFLDVTQTQLPSNAQTDNATADDKYFRVH